MRLVLEQLLDVTKEDLLVPMRDKSVDFCYSEDDDDQSNSDSQPVSGGNNFHDTLIFLSCR